MLDLLEQDDAKAFEIIFYRYYIGLYQFARSQISDKEECEEIVQDIFLWLWQRRHDLNHITNLKAYLYQAVRYQVATFFRRSKQREQYEQNYKFFESLWENVSKEVDEESRRNKMDAIISKLPKRCREAVKLRLGGMSHQEIAEAMGIETKTIETYMSLCFNRFRECRRSDFS